MLLKRWLALNDLQALGLCHVTYLIHLRDLHLWLVHSYRFDACLWGLILNSWACISRYSLYDDYIGSITITFSLEARSGIMLQLSFYLALGLLYEKLVWAEAFIITVLKWCLLDFLIHKVFNRSLWSCIERLITASVCKAFRNLTGLKNALVFTDVILNASTFLMCKRDHEILFAFCMVGCSRSYWL